MAANQHLFSHTISNILKKKKKRRRRKKKKVVSRGIKTCACFHRLQYIHIGWQHKSLNCLCSVYLQGKEQGSKCSGRRAKRKREQISSRFSVVAAYTNVSKSSVSSVGPVFFQPQSCYHCYHQTGFDPIQKNLFWGKKPPKKP